jgi:hypothetical protein
MELAVGGWPLGSLPLAVGQFAGNSSPENRMPCRLRIHDKSHMGPISPIAQPL